MIYGVCHIGIVPVRIEKSDASEMVTQLLYGCCFKVVNKQKKWSFIKICNDNYEGWIDNKQYQLITENDYKALIKAPIHLSKNIVDYVSDAHGSLYPIPLGSNLNVKNLLNHSFEGDSIHQITGKQHIINIAFLYLNTPYLWGGKTPFGIDCSGFTQMVYRFCGYNLHRDASQQASQGEALSFIEESEPGDLAFFDNQDGHIIHVGIIMADNYIIHAHGKIRIDRLDHSGIYNNDLKTHTHKLRVIKKML